MKVILHPGLPKTATTTLQEVHFSSLSPPAFYAGKIVGMDSTSRLYADIKQATYSKELSYSTEKSVREELATIFRHYNTVLVSDEMWLVDTERSSWQESIRRLGELFSNSDVTVAIVVREPIDAAYSLFVELWTELSDKNRVFEEYLRSNQAKVFHYEYLAQTLERCFPSASIVYFSFEDLIKPEGFTRFLSAFGLSSSGSERKRLNAKTVDSSGYVRKSGDLKSRLNRLAIVRWLIANSRSRWYSGLSRLLSDVPIGRPKAVPYPSTQQISKFYRENEEDLFNFELRTGIRFQREFSLGVRPERRDGT